MREPKLGQLKVDEAGTARFRSAVAGQKTVKITINLDTQSLRALKEASRQTGVPYHGLVGRLVKDAVAKRVTTEARLDRLERELKKMKRILVA